MDSLPVILDISSDDDEPCCDGEDYDWLSEVLNSAEDDSDDVVVLSEVSRRRRAKQVEKGFDEDCVILDGDPDKADGAVNEPQAESDELLIVGEKGQVACRDFPHSRQHCAKFPFNSTPPEKHCNLCHCYVCDSIAPCKYWGKGSSIYDHCHATEKEEGWKVQRENHKKRKRAPPSVPKFPYTSYSVSQINSVPRHNNVQPSTVIQSQVSRVAVIRACTSSTSNPVTMNQVSNPRVRSHTKGYMAQHFMARNRNKNQHHLAAPRSNDLTRQERDHSIGNPGARYASSQRSHERKGNMFLDALPSRSQVQRQPISHQSLNGRKWTFSDSQSQLPPRDYFPLSGESNCASDPTLPDSDYERWFLDNDALQGGHGAPIDAGRPYLDFEEWLMGDDRVIH